MIDSERMTAELHRGLAGVCEERPALRLATVATMVRLAGEVCIDKTHTVVRVELRDPEAAFQLRRQISEISPRPVDSEIITTSGCSLRYLVRVTARGSDLARVLGLIDRRGVAVLGLPPSVIAGGPALAPGVWRGGIAEPAAAPCHLSDRAGGAGTGRRCTTVRCDRRRAGHSRRTSCSGQSTRGGGHPPALDRSPIGR
jgi:hypothetical protein